MDLTTLFLVYAGILSAVAVSLGITWRQNPNEIGARTWAVGSGLAAVALVGYAISGPHPELAWLNASSDLFAWMGIAFYARGTRQFVGLTPTPSWMWGAYGLGAVTMFTLVLATPYGQGGLIIVGSAIFALFSFDMVWVAFRSKKMRNAPSYFIAFFFGSFGITHCVRGTMTLFDYAQSVYERPIDVVLIFVGILGGAATAMGFAMLTTERLLKERADNIQMLTTAVEHLREQFVGLAKGDYKVRAELDHAAPPLNSLGELFNDTVERVEQTQAQLQMTDRLAAMGTVAAGVAHEINNPLAYVMTNLDYVVEEFKESGLASTQTEWLAALEAAQEGSERVRRIVKDLKNLTRSRSDDNPQGPVEVNHLIESAAAMLGNEVRHHAQLSLELKEIPSVIGSEAKLGQVFINLIHNAAQAIPLGHASENEIRVRSRVQDGMVVVEVEDTGAGIEPEHLARIFDAFFTTKLVGVGTGLGLALCHQVVQGMGGRIEVDTELGQGTTFRVLLPATDDKPEGAIASTKSPSETLGRRVLVIDDEIEVGNSAKRILGKLHQVDVVGSARDGLVRIAAKHYDIILCDVMMPEMTGMQLYREIESARPELAKRFVFMSGGVFSAEVEGFLKEVEDRMIAKPFRATLLRKLVSELEVASEPQESH